MSNHSRPHNYTKSDEILNPYAVVGTFDEIGRKLRDRYAGIVTDAEFSIPVNSEADQETLAGILREIKAA